MSELRARLVLTGLLVVTAMLAGMTHAPAAAPEKGWFVIVASAPMDTDMQDVQRRANAALAPCKVFVGVGTSGLYRGFTSGFVVALTGPYKQRVQADAIALKARTCQPGAYVRYGEYIGEP